MEQTEISQKRTAIVFLFSLCVMVAELTVGLLSHSMALQADGIHMGSHVLVLGLNWGAFLLADGLRRRGRLRYSKARILNLSAWTSGIFLLLLAGFILTETIERTHAPHVRIATTEALLVAGIGLVVNVICALVLRGHHADPNSHAAFLHIVADVLTKVGVIVGLLCAHFWDITFVDAAVAIVAALVVVRWAWRLLLSTGRRLTTE